LYKLAQFSIASPGIYVLSINIKGGLMEGRRYKTKGHIGAYKTYTLLEKHETEPVTGIAIPSLEAVEQAKHTVDEETRL
jgi:hypothetical protein